MGKGNLSLFLLCFIALHFLLNSPHKSAAFQSEKLTGGSSEHFHIVEVSSLLTASACRPSARVSSEEESSLKLVHKYGPCSPRKYGKTNPPHPFKILERDQARVSLRASRQLHGENNDVQIRWDNTGEYVVNVGLGTPKRDLTLVIDTGSSLLWTQCNLVSSETLVVVTSNSIQSLIHHNLPLTPTLHVPQTYAL